MLRRSILALGALLIALVAPMTASATQKPLKILALGDSLTAGFGVGAGDALPARLEAALRSRGHDVKVINAGVSGETAQDGLARLDWSFEPDTDAAIVAFGGNDFLRGLPPAVTRSAIDGMVANLRDRGLPVLIAGMRAPTNMGPDYIKAFDAIYPEVARTRGALLYPFLLDGVALDATLNQPDGIHPNPKGVEVIVNRMLPIVEDLIRAAKARRG